MTGGQFELTSTPQSPITSFTQAQIAAGQVVFVHDGDEAAPTYSVSVSDGNTSSTAQAATISFTSVNDAPVLSFLSGEALTVTNDGTAAMLDIGPAVVLHDPDNPADYDGGILTVTGVGLDGADTLDLDTSGAIGLTGTTDGSSISVSGLTVGTIAGYSGAGVTVTFNSNATRSHVESVIGALQFASTSTTFGVRTVELTFNDNDGVLNGGVQLSPTATVFVSVAQAGSGFVSTNEDITYTFVVADFEFTGTSAADIQTITITALPSEGTLTLNGSNVALNDVITHADLDNGLFRFVPDSNEFGGAYASFDFTINGGNSSLTVLPGDANNYTPGGISLDPTTEILSDATAFGPGGTVATSLIIAEQTTNIDAAYLANGEILFHGFVPDGNMTADELNDIQAWVQSGGILISTSDDPTYDAVSNRYGLGVTATTNTVWNNVNSSHEIMDGPFGAVGPTFQASGAISYFSSGVTGSDIVLARDSISNQPTMIIRQDNAGWILFTSDEGIFRAGVSNDGVINTDNERLIANIFAWAVGNVPASETYTLTVAVDPIADTPAITNSATAEDTQTSTGLTVSRNIVDGAEVSHYQITNIVGGSLFLNDGTTAITNGDFISHAQASSGLKFTPANDSVATGRFDLQAATSASISGLGGSVVTATISVSEVNDAPVRTAGTVSNLTVNEDSGLTSLGLGGLAYSTGGGTDESSQTLTYTVTSVPNSALGDIVLADGVSVVSAATTYNLSEIQGMQFRTASQANGGPATFAFTITDNGTTSLNPDPKSISESLTISVNAVADQPTVDSPIGNITVNEDAVSTTIDLTTIFGDVDILTNGDSLTFTVESNNNTTLVDASISGNTLTLDYLPEQNGTASIVVRATDTTAPTALFIEDTISLTVNPVADQPTVDSPIGNVTVNEDAVSTTIDLTTVFGDVDIATNADSHIFTVESNNNTTLVDATISGNTLTLDYLPEQNGTASIVVRATDTTTPTALFIEDTISLTVNPVADQPTVDSPIGNVTVNEDAVSTTIDLTTVFGDVDIATNADSLTFTVESNDNTTLVDASISGSTLTLDYLPEQNGTASIVIRATDTTTPTALFIEDTISLTVNPVADQPTVDAPIGNVTVDEDAVSTTIDLTAVFGDVDIATNADFLTFTVESNNNTTLVDALVSGNTLTLDYLPEQNGTASIVVRATDTTTPTALFIEDTIALTVNSIADQPTVESPIGNVTVNEDAVSTTIDLTTVFGDVDIATNSDLLTFTVESNNNTTLVDAAISGNTLTLDYLPEQNGTASIIIRATDTTTPTALFVEDTISLTVNPVADQPTVDSPIGNITVNEDAVSTTIDLTSVFGDVDIPTNGDSLSFTVESNNNTTLVDASVSGNMLTLDYLPEQNGTASITLRATDTTTPTALFIEDTISLTANAVADQPTVDSPIGNVTVNEDAVSTTIDLTTVFGDVDIPTNSDSLTFTVESNDNTTLVNASISGNTLTLDYLPEQNGTASIIIRATDTTAPTALFIEDTISLTVNAVADQPTVDAPIANVTVNEDAVSTTIDLTTVFGDVDIATNADSLTFTVESNNNTTLADASISGNTLTLDYLPEQNGTAAIVIRATDTTTPASLFIEDTISLTVNSIADQPTIDNGIGSVVVDEDALSTTIDLTTVFGDVDIATNADSLTFTVEANDNTTLVDATISGNTLTLDYLPEQNGMASIVIRATDTTTPTPLFIEDTISLVVNAVADQPTVNSPIGTETVDEDAVSTTIDLTTIFSDVDIATNADSLTFTVESNNNTTLVDASISGNMLTLDYLPEQNGTASITIRATDTTNPTALFIEDTIALTVNSIADQPTVDNPIGPVVVDEDAASTIIDLTTVFGDNDILTNGDALTFHVSSVSNPVIVDAVITGDILTLNYLPDQNGTATIEIMATDTTFPAALTTIDIVDLTINPINDPPEISLINVASDLSESVDTSAAIRIADIVITDDLQGDNTLQITGPDAEHFEISGSELRLKADTSLDFETQSTFHITVVLDDVDFGTAFEDTVTLTLNLLDENDNAPVITPPAFSVPEDIANGDILGTFTATDADTVGTINNWQIQSGDPNGVFEINDATGEIRIRNNSSVDFETTSQYVLEIAVSDGVHTTVESFEFNVLDINEAPELTGGAFSIDENTPGGTVAFHVELFDQDFDDSHEFVIATGNVNNIFTIDSVTGVISVNDPTSLDFESLASLTLRISAIDAAGLTDSTTLDIMVNDINETPTLTTLSNSSIAENSLIGSMVGTASTTDPDFGDTVRYQLVDSADGLFTIDATTGDITVASAELNFEDSIAHHITILATDSGGLSIETNWQMDVININEPPQGADDRIELQELTHEGWVLMETPEADADLLTAILVNDVISGTLSFHSDGSFQYVAEIGFEGAVSFDYIVTDGVNQSETFQVVLVVNQIVGAPNVADVGVSNTLTPDDSKIVETTAETSETTEQTVKEVDTESKTSTAVVTPLTLATHHQNREAIREFNDPEALEFLTESQESLSTIVSYDSTPQSESLLQSQIRQIENRSAFETRELSVNYSASNTISSVPLAMVFEGLNGPRGQELAESYFDSSALAVGSTAIVSTSLSVGYVVWLIRGGSLFASLVTSIPAWQAFDPLPVLDAFEEDENENGEEESLASIADSENNGNKTDQ